MKTPRIYRGVFFQERTMKSEMHKRRLSGLLLGGGLILLLQGCGGMPSIKVDSDPAGATVLASGRQIGTTPLTIVPDEAFPPRFVGGSYRAVGDLVIEKPGCERYRKKVNDFVLSRDISVKLKCDPSAMQAPAATSAPATTSAPNAAPRPPAASAAPAGSGNVRQRLKALEGLKRDGLITEQEYNTIRQRILNSL
jgi:hypothetical protein